MKRLFLLTAMAASLSAAAQVWDKTFPQSDQVSVEKVSFKNRYDITVVADMYLPKNLNRSQEHAAIVIGHPFGGVKEQSSGLYAQQLAERGFVTLAFDLSYGGESGGTPRHLASPETYVDDFSAAVDFAGNRSSTGTGSEPSVFAEAADSVSLPQPSIRGSGRLRRSACTIWGGSAARDIWM